MDDMDYLKLQKRRKRDITKLLMSDYEVTQINSSSPKKGSKNNESLLVLFKGPKDTPFENGQ